MRRFGNREPETEAPKSSLSRTWRRAGRKTKLAPDILGDKCTMPTYLLSRHILTLVKLRAECHQPLVILTKVKCATLLYFTPSPPTSQINTVSLCSKRRE